MADLPDTIVFFDGECLLCDRGVQWLERHDPHRRLHFAPLGGETFQFLKAEGADVGLAEPGRSMLLAQRVEDGTWRTMVRAEAVIGALAATGGVPKRLAMLRLVPKPLRNLGYRIVAAVRYGVFGKVQGCSLASGRAAERLLP